MSRWHIEISVTIEADSLEKAQDRADEICREIPEQAYPIEIEEVGK
jgi:hypothetical protein